MFYFLHHIYSNVRADLQLMHLFNGIVSMILVVKNDLSNIWISPIRVIPPNALGFLDA